MNVILYTTHCPQCEILEKKLNDKKIPYEEITDTLTMIKKGFSVVPVLEVEGVTYSFSEANKWINQQ